MAQELRHALRRLGRTPGFTLAALLTLALGIGANTALFSVVHAVLLEALPFREPERLFAVFSRHTSTDRYPFQLPEFCDYRERNRTLDGLAAYGMWSASLRGEGPAERLTGARVSGDFFEVLGVAAARGRLFRSEDDRPGSQKVAVVTDGFWVRRLGGAPDAVGRDLVMNGEAYRLLGVLPPAFLPPLREAEVFVPLAPDADPWRHDRGSSSFLRLIARAKMGVDRGAVAADLEAIAGSLREEWKEAYARKQGVRVVPYRDEVVRNFETTLLVLQAAVGLLLLIACANLANLVSVRAAGRRRELAVRRALGASAGRIVRPLLLEGALLALGGALLGCLLAAWSVPTLLALSPVSLPRASGIRIDLPVLAFTFGAAGVSLVLFGLLPALRAARADPGEALKQDTRTTASGGRLRGLAVGAQVALMTVLLVGAALLFASFRAVLRISPGFDSHVLTVRLSLPRSGYPDLARVSRFYREVEERVVALPGVTAVAAVNHVPLNGALASADYKVEDAAPEAAERLPTANYRMVTPDYFRAMGIPLRAGRAFGEDDREGRAPVAIVSEALVRRSFPDGRPLGRRLLVSDNPAGFRSLEVVGVVGDVKHAGLEAEVDPHVYVPYHQTHPQLLVWLALGQFLVVRSEGAPLALADPVRRAVMAVDPEVATADPRPAGHYAETAAAPRRFGVVLQMTFAGLALALAGVGLYGVAAHAAEERRSEAAVRVALGARPRDVLRLALAEALRRSLRGLLLGVTCALAATHLLRGLFFGVGPADPRVFAGVALLVLVTTLAAGLGPAWRAARADPAASLRGN